MCGKFVHIGLAVAAVAIVDLAIFYLWDNPIAVEFIVGSAVGLVGATAMRSGQGWDWLGYLAGLLFIFALYLWIVRPLIGRSSRLFAGFDGSNPAVLLPGILTLAGCALGFALYMLIGRPEASAE
jgi:hypothetical protein